MAYRATIGSVFTNLHAYPKIVKALFVMDIVY
jgi:hypothetical protein